RQEFSTVKSVNVKLGCAGLVAADEMAGQTDASNGQAQASRDQQIHQAKVNRISSAPIQNTVQVAVLRIVIILIVAGKTQFLEKIFVDGGQERFGSGAQIQPNSQIARITIQ